MSPKMEVVAKITVSEEIGGGTFSSYTGSSAGSPPPQAVATRTVAASAAQLRRQTFICFFICLSFLLANLSSVFYNDNQYH